MRTKLTLTLERDTIREAKRYARTTGTSLSQLVGFYFFSLSSSSPQRRMPLPPITSSLAQLAPHPFYCDEKQVLADALTEKYL
jgi:hypothetical protein